MIRPTPGTRRIGTNGPRNEEPTFGQLLTDTGLERVENRVKEMLAIRRLFRDYENRLQGAYDSGDAGPKALHGVFGLTRDKKGPMEVFSDLSRIEAELREIARENGKFDRFKWPDVPEGLGYNGVDDKLLKHLRKIAAELGANVVDATGYPLGYNAREISEQLGLELPTVQSILDLMETRQNLRVFIMNGEKYYRASDNIMQL